MNLSLDNLPINFFDVALLVIIMAGIAHGRKRGMSGELLSLLKWLAVLVGCSLFYEPLGQLLVQTSDVFTPLSGYVMAYILVGLLIFLIFAGVSRTLGGKLIGSDVFGHSEYYLGMGSGLVRALCILLVLLALLNARLYSVAEIKDWKKFTDDVYGSDYFPGLHTLQSSVFEKSLTGPWIKENLGFMLIKPTRPQQHQFKQRDAWVP